MKKTIVAFFAVMLFSAAAYAQNIQMYYDFERKAPVATFEIFKPDKLGSTFFMTDYYFKGPDGVNMVYFELHREFNIGKKWGAHLQYDDGLSIGSLPDGGYSGYPLDQVAHAGVFVPIHFGKFVLNTVYLVRYAFNKQSVDGQIEAIWNHNFLKSQRLTFKGFFYIWSEKFKMDSEGKWDSARSVGILAEPQLWFNINKSFAVGTELEFSNNFAGVDGFKFRPCLGIKWEI